MVLSLADEACAAGLPADLVRPAFVDKWIAGGSRIDMEIASALLEKMSTVSSASCPPCRTYWITEQSQHGNIDISIEDPAVCRQSDELQESEFKLVAARLEHDVKAWQGS